MVICQDAGCRGVVGVAGVTLDVTAGRRRGAGLQSKRDVVERPQRAMSTPSIEVGDQVVCLPIGLVDAARPTSRTACCRRDALRQLERR